jgi:membrane dipeptidase
MTDDMIKALAAKGGVIQINYHAAFLSQEFKDADTALEGDVVKQSAERQKNCGDDADCQTIERERATRELVRQGKLPHVSWEKIIEHIDHVVKLVGPDHVGLGSDFDGAFMPEGMEDCSHLPQITDALVRKGYRDEDIRKSASSNGAGAKSQSGSAGTELNMTRKDCDALDHAKNGSRSCGQKPVIKTSLRSTNVKGNGRLKI